MTLYGLQLAQPVKDLDGKLLYKKIMPTPEELKAAKEAGKTEMEVKEEPYTVLTVIKDSLLTDLSQRTMQGFVPDPHEDKKYEIYELTRKLLLVGPEDTVTLESEQITLIKDRMRKVFNIAAYGFVVEVLSGKNKDFAVIPQTAHHQV